MTGREGGRGPGGMEQVRHETTNKENLRKLSNKERRSAERKGDSAETEFGFGIMELEDGVEKLLKIINYQLKQNKDMERKEKQN